MLTSCLLVASLPTARSGPAAASPLMFQLVWNLTAIFSMLSHHLLIHALHRRLWQCS